MIQLLQPRPIALTIASLTITLFSTDASAQGSWASTRNAMTTARDAHSILQVGTMVLIIGGRISASGTTSARADYYASRSFFPAILLDNGKVLAPGGYQQSYGGGTIRSCELFTPSTGSLGTATT